MSEYWKSNPRKFCDFCKCWIADNKPSIEFHERGKRHKENVQTRLEEIGRKGKEDYENKLKENDYMREMEEAALKAYKKDIEENPDFTATKITEIAQASNAKIVISKTDEKVKEKPVSASFKEPKQKKISPKTLETKNQVPKKWREAKTPEGFSYYWNSETGESVWEAPKEGYISLEETAPKTGKKKKEICSETKKSETPANQKPYGPILKVNPYGNWESAHQEQEEIDLQLPSLPEQEYYAPEVIIKKPDIKFKEKIVTLSKDNSDGPVSFKKRKGGDEHKKNVRRRIDES